MLSLCYVDGPWAWFTDDPNQTGDDWDDAPYQHNAGTPYETGQLVRVVFELDAVQPVGNWSVDDINACKVPWLSNEDTGLVIMAGIELYDFFNKVFDFGGKIWVPIEREEK